MTLSDLSWLISRVIKRTVSALVPGEACYPLAQVTDGRGGIIDVMADVTQILSQIESGDPSAGAQLLPMVYEELRKLAAARLAQENAGQTLQATSLVHEAFIRLVDCAKAPHWTSRGHFFGAAAEAMRRILVEQARRRQTLKRGGQGHRVPLASADVGLHSPADDILDIDEALSRLTAEDPEAARLVQLRYFAGLSIEDAAESIGISRSTAYEHWSYGRVRLRILLGSPPALAPPITHASLIVRYGASVGSTARR